MEDKVRVSEIAEEAGATSTEVINKAKDLGISLKAASSSVSYEDAEEIANYIMTGDSKLLKKKIPAKKAKIQEEEPKIEERPEIKIEEKPVEKEQIKPIEKKPSLKRGTIKKVEPIKKVEEPKIIEKKEQSKEDEKVKTKEKEEIKEEVKEEQKPKPEPKSLISTSENG
jgi:translation initiation factor IF-2